MNVRGVDGERNDLTDFADRAAGLGVAVVRGELLGRHTTFRIGGPADFYAAATTVDQLEGLSALAVKFGLPVTILGGGSNVLVSDAGIRGLVIANQARGHGFGPAYRPDWLSESMPPGRLAAESGVAAAGLARTAIRSGYAGLEWAVSVPGTIGGAVIGNAGAHGGDVSMNLAWALVSYPSHGRRLLNREDLKYGYRTSVLKDACKGNAGRPPLVLAAAFDLAPGDVTELTERADGYLQKRRSSQPVEPSAGSIFRNPPGGYAGQLIEAAGLKGYSLSGAQISPRHANFIVNTGDARAADVAALINVVRRTVFDATGIRLVPEILFLGEWIEAPLSAL
jgi:UDP-N-acetylmuramate dehydrogenase